MGFGENILRRVKEMLLGAKLMRSVWLIGLARLAFVGGLF